MHTSPILILFLAYQDHRLGLLYYLTLMDARNSDEMDVCQCCNVPKFSQFYAFPIPYSYINVSLLPDHHHLNWKGQHAAAIIGCAFSRYHSTLQTNTMCHQHVSSI